MLFTIPKQNHRVTLLETELLLCRLLMAQRRWVPVGMLKSKEDNLRNTQKKLTSAANTIQKELLNVRSMREQFTNEEQELLRQSVQVLLSFKEKVKHSKEKHIRAQKKAEREEANVKAVNERTINKVVKSIPVNVATELSLLYYYRGDELAEERLVSSYLTDLLRDARTDPVQLKRLYDVTLGNVEALLLSMLPKQKYGSGFDSRSGDWEDFLHPPEASTEEFVTELVKKHMIHCPIKLPENVAYVDEVVRLINLARSVNQTIDGFKQSK